MESPFRRTQKYLVNRTQRRLNRLMRQMVRAKIRKRANDQDLYEDMIARSIARMFTRSLTMNALTARVAMTTTTTESPVEGGDTTDNMCHDIRGRDRACCNTALACFDDVANVIEDLEHAPNDYSLLSACRVVSDELKRDRVCIKQGLSGCDGTGKAVLQRRFDNRISNLYDQFYKHCRGRTVAPSTSTPRPTTTELTEVTTRSPLSTQKPASTVRVTTPAATGGSGTYTNNPPTSNTQNTQHVTHDGGLDSGAIIVGAVTGGAILIVLLIIAIVLWCRNRKDRYDSDGSAASSGVFFQKRPNVPSSNGPHRNNNNKAAATRQDSTVYAEIDERFVNAGYKPPLPADMTNAGYLHPIGDEEADHYNQPSNISGGVPMATTRGQLSYGAILAANTNSASEDSLFYYSTSLTPPGDRNSGRELPSIPQTGNEDEPNRSLFTSKPPLRKDNSYVECHGDLSGELDEYEEPVSAHNSVKYAHAEADMSPPYEPAPGIPADAMATPENRHRKMAVKVLPSDPFGSTSATFSPKNSSDPNTPVAKPRRKKQSSSDKSEAEAAAETEGQRAKLLDLDLSKVNVSNRDSSVSDSSVKSSHHYFVLEPENAPHSPSGLDYENSVSSPKLV